MWADEENTVLESLPSLIVRQIMKGADPCELTGLPVSVLEYIKKHQLTKQDVLILSGLSVEQARDMIHRKRRNGGKAKERR